jgi:hypothetical protein
MCDMVTKPTGRRRGRPRLPLRNDPERYLLAYFVAQCRLKKPGMSDREIALTLTAVRYGEIANEPEYVTNFVTSSGPVGFEYAVSIVHGDEESSEPRNESAFHARADDLARKARRKLNEDLGSDDGSWLLNMSNAWIVTLAGEPFDGAMRLASAFCLVEREIAFFYRVVQPIIQSRFDLGPVPHFTMPDFIPHEAA